MASLAWDSDNIRPFAYGVSKGVLYIKKNYIEPDAITDYENGVAWSGLIGVTTTVEGFEATPLASDGYIYDILRSPELLSGTIEAYTYPDELSYCDGSISERSFGFCYRTDNSDGTYVLHLLYNCDAYPEEREYETLLDSPDAINFSWYFVSNSVEHPRFMPVCEVLIDTHYIDPGTMIYIENALYGCNKNEPYLPNFDKLLELASMIYTAEFIKAVWAPAKVLYVDGDPINISGLIVNAYISDGTPYITERYPYGTVPNNELMLSFPNAVFDKKFVSSIIKSEANGVHGDVTGRKTVNEDGVYMYYSAVIENAVANVYQKQIINNIENDWTYSWTVGSASDVAIEFDGIWIRQNDIFYLQTEEYPYVFTVVDGYLFAQKWTDYNSRILLAENVSSISACKGWKSELDRSLDQGLIIAYLQNGIVKYRSYCDDGTGVMIWQAEEEIEELGSGNESLSLIRTNDYRIGFLVEKSGYIYLALSKRTYPGNLFDSEHIYIDNNSTFECSEPIKKNWFGRDYVWADISYNYFTYENLDEGVDNVIVNTERINSDSEFTTYGVKIYFSKPVYCNDLLGLLNRISVRKLVGAVESSVELSSVELGDSNISLTIYFVYDVSRIYQLTIDGIDLCSAWYYRTQNQKSSLSDFSFILAPQTNDVYVFENEHICIDIEPSFTYLEKNSINAYESEHIYVDVETQFIYEPTSDQPI